MGQWETLGQSDEWYTPVKVFEALGVRFDIDVAAPAATKTFVPADRFITEHSLNQVWSGFVWMNPPFGRRNALKPWLKKFLDHGNGVALVPDRTSAPWFRDALARCDLVLFTPKLKFHRPDGSIGKSPANGTALIAVGRRGEEALLWAASLGLGSVCKPVRTAQLDEIDARRQIACHRVRETLRMADSALAGMSNDETMGLVRILENSWLQRMSSAEPSGVAETLP
jgi:hypothetical protein